MASVLVVEDEGIIAMHLRRTLTGFGWDVVGTAPSGEEAVQLADNLQPDLVLMDIRLKGSSMDGIEAAQRIRMRRPVPIIYLSAYVDEATLSRVAESSNSAFTRLIPKPFDPQRLKAAMDGVLAG